MRSLASSHCSKSSHAARSVLSLPRNTTQGSLHAGQGSCAGGLTSPSPNLSRLRASPSGASLTQHPHPHPHPQTTGAHPQTTTTGAMPRAASSHSLPQQPQFHQGQGPGGYLVTTPGAVLGIRLRASPSGASLTSSQLQGEASPARRVRRVPALAPGSPSGWGTLPEELAVCGDGGGAFPRLLVTTGGRRHSLPASPRGATQPAPPGGVAHPLRSRSPHLFEPPPMPISPRARSSLGADIERQLAELIHAISPAPSPMEERPRRIAPRGIVVDCAAAHLSLPRAAVYAAP